MLEKLPWEGGEWRNTLHFLISSFNLLLLIHLQDGGKQLLDGLVANKTLTEFDLRLTEVGQETEYLIHQIVWANWEAARLVSLQHPPAKPL